MQHTRSTSKARLPRVSSNSLEVSIAKDGEVTLYLQFSGMESCPNGGELLENCSYESLRGLTNLVAQLQHGHVQTYLSRLGLFDLFTRIIFIQALSSGREYH